MPKVEIGDFLGPPTHGASPHPLALVTSDFVIRTAFDFEFRHLDPARPLVTMADHVRTGIRHRVCQNPGPASIPFLMHFRAIIGLREWRVTVHKLNSPGA